MTITIPNYRAKSRNLTATSHWRTYQGHRDEIAEFIQTYTKDKSQISPALVYIEAFYKGKRSVDTSNIDDKMIVDGLMKVGILKDDTATENPIVVKKSHQDTGINQLIITVEKLL